MARAALGQRYGADWDGWMHAHGRRLGGGAERTLELSCVGESVGWVHGERAREHALESNRCMRCKGPERRRRRPKALGGNERWRGTAERQPPRHELEHGERERIHVGGGGRLFALQHLRRQVGDGAKDLPRLLRRERVGYLAGDAEVGDLHLATAGQKDVLRLHIAMHDSLGVGVVKGSSDLPAKANGFVLREGTVPVENLTQRPAVDIFHDQVRPAS